MSKLLQIITPLAATATAPISPSANTTPITAPSSNQTSPLATNNEYVPGGKMSFTNHKDVLEKVINNLPPNDPNSVLAAVIFGLSIFVDKFNDDDFVIDTIVKTAPFTSVSGTFESIVQKQIVDEFIKKFLPTISSSGATQLELSGLAAQQLDVLRKNIIDEFNAFAPQPDIYLNAFKDADIDHFIDNLKTAKIPLKETDLPTLKLAATKKVLDSNLNDSVDEFQKAINQKYKTLDDFKNALLKMIASDFIDNDKISEDIKSEVDGVYKTADENIKKFGLTRLTSQFEDVKAQYEDLLDGKTAGTPGTKEIADKLKTDLENATTITEVTKSIDDFTAARNNLTKITEDMINNKAKDLITHVKND